MRRPLKSTGVIDACVIFQPCAFGVCQTVLPVSQSTAIIRTLSPAGARIARSLSMSGHWPAYHFGTIVL